jgi:hypothetical protein
MPTEEALRARVEQLEQRLMMAITPVINEFMASNDNTIDDVDGDSSDWIEIYNPGDQNLNLDGYFLTDDAAILDKWRMPAVTVSPGGYLLVFASGKDRATVGQELHTNFQLNGDGGYLGLIAPDHTSVLSSYDYPQQATDVSYGLSLDTQTSHLVNTGASVKVLVPTNGTLGTTWTTPTFNDATWTTGTTGVGYDLNTPPPPISGWSIKMVDVDAGMGSIPTATRILGGDTSGYNVSFSGSKDYATVNQALGGDYGPDDLLPNGLTDTDYYALRATANVFIPAGTWSFDVGSDDGFSLTIPGATFTNKVNQNTNGVTTVRTDTIYYSAPRGHAHTSGTITVPAGGLHTVMTLDFYEDAGGDDVELSVASGTQAWNSSFVLLSDAVLPGWTVKTTSSAPPPNYLSLINTNTQAAMLNNNASALIRTRFTIENPADYDILRLRMKYDDGFVAYMNGTEVARRNAPGAVTWNSAASAEHTEPASFTYEDINIPLSTLVAGVNVLAIQGLNLSPGDEDFLIYPELEGVTITATNERYFQTPTPGAANVNSTLQGVVSDTKFNVERGFYNSPFELTITSTTPGAQIRYTLDGSEPTATTGLVYSGPVFIDHTTTVRAAAFKTTFISTNVDTETYIFTADVVTQSANGAPPNIGGVQWPVGPLPPSSQTMDYGMDPDIVNNPAWSSQVQAELKALPTFSIVMNPHDFWDTNGIYANPSGDGMAWERPASIELINPDGTTGFQANAGLRIRGGYSRSTGNPKHGFRVFFRDQYGTGKLNYPLFGPGGDSSLDGFDLRTFENYSWSFEGNPNNIMIQDQVIRDAQIAMGQPGSRGNYYHLYIDGQYFGIFNTDERPEATYGASYFGGTPDDYDVLKTSGDAGYNIYATDGNTAAWTDFWNQVVNLKALADAGQDTNAAFLRMQGLNPDGTRNPAYPVQLDLNNLIDYNLINFYGGNLDAALSNFLGNTSPNNIFMIRNRNGQEGWRFVEHDAEHTLLNVNEDRTGPFYISTGGVPSLAKSNPQSIFEILELNPEFRVAVGDRIRKWFFNDGVLAPAGFQQLFMARQAELDKGIVDESARWGDSKTATPITRDNWINAINDKLTNYIPQRSGIVFNQLSADGLYSAVTAPDFSQYNSTINSGFSLTLTNPGGQGTIYYTINGQDPRLFGGGIAASAQAYSNAIILNQTTTVRARVRLTDGTWSAMTEATFKLNLAALRVTEINYNPSVPVGSPYTSQDYEFLELQNTGATPINPGGATFSNGITFTFPSMTMAPGSRILLVRNVAAFESRYGSGLNVVGAFGGALNDAGEEITLVQGNSTVFDFTYSDGWYPITDGGGYTLTALSPTQAPALFSQAAGWRASDTVNGTPGTTDVGPNPGVVIINEVMSNPTAAPGDYIELKNTSAAPVNIGGWWLSNDPLSLKKYQIPAGTTIAAGGYIVFTEQNNFGAAGLPGAAVPFTISDLGDDIYLSNNGTGGNLGGYREHVDFGAAAPSIPFGIYTKSTGGTDFVAQSTQTPAAANALPLFGPIVMSEIMYNPLAPGDEFIELQNLTGSTFSLYDAVNGNGWKFNEGVDFTFGVNDSLPASGYGLVVGIDPALFRSRYSIPASVPIFGPWTGALDDNGENVKLSKPGTPQSSPTGPIVPYIIEDQVHYNDKLPWPADADGLGPSLMRVPATAYGNDAGNWIAGPNGGTPGAPFVPPANPYALTATATGTTTVTLSWTDFSNSENGFKIERSTDNVTFTQIGTAATNQTTYNDSGLTPGTRYFYRVRAFNNAGNSTFSNKASVLTQASQTLTLIGTATAPSTNPFTDTWSYYQTEAAGPANDSGGRDWKNRLYTETAAAGWAGPSPGLLYVENAVLGAPKTTLLNLGGLTNGTDPVTPTFYFRKHFNLSVSPSAVTSLVLQTYVDDVARIYFNGTVVWNIGIPDTAVLTHTTYDGAVGGRSVGDAALETFTLPQSAINALLPGDNVIAVEVHQVNNTSSDIVWGATLTATVNASASLVTPDIVDVTPDPRPSGPDTMTINFSEPVSGLDLTDLALSRNGGNNLLTAAQTLTSSNGGATWTLGNLKSLTWVAGNYTLVLLAGNSGIVGTPSGTQIGPDALDSFQVTTTSITGTTGNDNFYVRINGSNFEVFTSIPPTGLPTYTVPITDISSLSITGDTGNDVVEVGTPLPFDPIFTGGAGTDRLVIDTGNRTFSGDLLASLIEELVVGGTSNVTFTVPQHLSSLTLNNTARLTLANGTGQLIDTNALAIAAGALLDLGDGDMIVHTASAAARQTMLDTIVAKIKSSRNAAPRWSGAGITDALAAGNPLVTVAAIGNVDNNGTLLKSTFDGVAVNSSAVLVKTTYYGDHDLDGDVDADDYAAIDAGFAQSLAGWFNGDNDFSGGRPNSDDYFRMDQAFSGQGAPLGAPSAAPAPAAAETIVQPQAPLAETVTVASTNPTAVAPGTFAVAVNTATTAAATAKKTKKHARPFDF